MFHFSIISVLQLLGMVAIAAALVPAAIQLAPDMWWVAHEGDTLTSRKKNGGYAPLFFQGHDWAMRSIEWKLDPATGDSGLAKLVHLEKGAAAVILRDDGARIWYLPGLETVDALLHHFGLIVNTKGGLGKLMKRLSRLFVQFRIGGWLTGGSVRVRFLNHGAARTKAYDGSAKFSRRFVLDLMQLRLDVDYQPKVDAVEQAIREAVAAGDLEHAHLIAQYEVLMIQMAEIRREAHNLREGEFTLMIGESVLGIPERGFWKGQATIIDTDEWDILLPRHAVKGELKLTGDRVFVGIKPISPHDHMTMDRQSLSNLETTADPSGLGFFSYDPAHPTVDRVILWLRQYLADYKAKVDDGHFNDSIHRQLGHLRWDTDSAKFLGFFLHEFIARGGDVRWFKHTLRGAYKLGLEKVEKFRKGTAYPIPGLRLYVRPASMGKMHVRRGQVAWDLDRGVIYINDVDAVTLDPRFQNMHQLDSYLRAEAKRQWPDEFKAAEASFAADAGFAMVQLCTRVLDTLTPGLQAKLGGYDNDDAFWVAPFIDFDGVKKALIWRSPNVPGERHILNYKSGAVPTEGLGYWFAADSRRLMDFTKWTIDPQYAIKPTGVKITGYNLESINRVAHRLIEGNKAVGRFCLMLRQLVLICGDLPATLPCGAEGVIDAVSKTFDDVSGVIAWVEDMAKALVLENRRVPMLIYEEFIRMLPREWQNSGQLPPMCDVGEHWIDRMNVAADAELATFKSETDIDANLATPPQELFDHALGWSTPGLGFKGAYGRHIFLARQRQENGTTIADEDPEYAGDLDDAGEAPETFEGQTDEQRQEALYDGARQASIDYLDNAGLTSDKWPMIMVGGLAAVYIDHIALRDAGIIDRDTMEPIRDSAFFQLGQSMGKGNGRLPGLDQITIQGLAQIGILGDLQWTQDEHGRKLCPQMRTLTPLAEVSMVRIRHGWFNFGLALGPKNGGLPANAQMRKMDPLLVADLKMRFAQMDLTGKTFTAKVVSVQIGPRMVDKPALVASNGKVLGLLQETKGITFDKPLKVVNAHTMNDDTWLMLS